MNEYNKTMQFPILTAEDNSAITTKTAAYTAGDCVGGLLKCHFGTDSGGLIRALHLVDKGVQAEPLTVFVYHSEPSAIADDAAYAPTDADALKELGRVSIVAGNYTAETAYSIVHKRGEDVNIEVPGNVLGTKGVFYLYLRCVDAADWVAATDLSITVDMWVD